MSTSDIDAGTHAGAGGGASDILNAGGAGGGGADAGGAAAGANGGGANDGGAAADAAPAEWMKGLTQDPDALKWLGNKAFPDPGKLVDAFRETERAFRTAIPSDSDPKERWDAFYKRLGRPDDPTGYEIKAPAGFEADPVLTEGFQKTLYENGIPPKAAAALVDWYNGQALAGLDIQAQAVKAQQAALKSEWGAEYGKNVEVARRGMELTGLDSGAIDKISMGYGVDNALKLFEKIGRMTSEDMLRSGGRTPGFTVDSNSAKQQVEAFQSSPEKVAKLRAGDPGAKAEWARLNAQMAAARDAEKKRA